MSVRQGLGLVAMSLALATAAGLNAFAADPGVVATAPTGTGAPAVSAASAANDATGSQIDAWFEKDGFEKDGVEKDGVEKDGVEKDGVEKDGVEKDGVEKDGVASNGGASQPGPDGPAPRTIHGEVGAGVGTGGYRNVYGVADIPVGQTGDLIVAASSTSGQVRGGRYGGYAIGGDALALGFSSNGAPTSASGCGRPLWGQAWASPAPVGCSGPPQP